MCAAALCECAAAVALCARQSNTLCAAHPRHRHRLSGFHRVAFHARLAARTAAGKRFYCQRQSHTPVAEIPRGNDQHPRNKTIRWTHLPSQRPHRHRGTRPGRNHPAATHGSYSGDALISSATSICHCVQA